MREPLACALLAAYLLVVMAMGVLAGRRGRDDADDFVAGDRAFGPLVMYFVMGATLFSAYALLGTPQRVVAKGSDVFYVLAYGSVGLVPLFYVGARVRRWGARHGFVTQAELVGARFDSRAITAMMAVGTLVAFWPYLVIQLKAAAIVVSWATGWESAAIGSGLVAAVVSFYVIRGGVRGVGWTNVLQGLAMLLIVWGVGLWIPHHLYGGVGPMLDRLALEHPEMLTLPGPGPTTAGQYSSEVFVSLLGFSVWPHVFMKCFTARSARLVRWSVVVYPSFLFFLLPLIFLGWVAFLEGGPAKDTVLLWLVDHEAIGAGPVIAALVAFAVLAASMSTLDALLHAGGSVLVRDLGVRVLGWQIGGREETRRMKLAIAVLALSAWLGLGVAERVSVFDLLLIGYDFIVQFVPVLYLGVLWRGANRVGAISGLASGLALTLLLQLWSTFAPESYAAWNPAALRPGVWALGLNLGILVLLSALRGPDARAHLDRFFPPR